MALRNYSSSMVTSRGNLDSDRGTWQHVEDGLRHSSEACFVDETTTDRKKHCSLMSVLEFFPYVIMSLVIAAGIFGIVSIYEEKQTSNLEVSPFVPSSTTASPTASSIENPTMESITVVGTPTLRPTVFPTTTLPTRFPSIPPRTEEPTAASTSTSDGTTTSPTNVPTDSINVTFVPGDLSVTEAGLLLSRGLRARVIGVVGQNIQYFDGTTSSRTFHGNPDFGATFPDTRPDNDGGWVYVSNSEMNITGQGGVGAITFDKDGNMIDYRMVLEGTTMNCGGGRTPWNTWVSCEEVENLGEIYQVDPFGVIPAQKATIGSQLGRWESFAYDNRNSADPRFFATEDHSKGTVRRFRPDPTLIDWDKPWDMLHVSGIIDYLVVTPNAAVDGGTFEWTNNLENAKNNARSYYPDSEGIDVYGGLMYVVCKRIKQMFVFDLDEGTYYNRSTVTGLFDGGPDQMQRILDDEPGDLLFFTEEQGKNAGVHARDLQDRVYTIMEGPGLIQETTGLAFSPNGKRMYVAYQKNGLLFDIWREDGGSFAGRSLNVKYHQTQSVNVRG